MRGFYNFAYAVVRPLCALFYPMRLTMRAQVPESGAIICANHSNYIDPVLLAFAVGKKHWLRFMAKEELASIPVLGAILRKLGVFFVNRSASDLGAIRTAMKLLKGGEKVMIFPEGTRVSSDDAVAAKGGAIRLAMRLGVPIVPIFIKRNKKIFHRADVVVGVPYTIAGDADPQEQAEALMHRIYELAPGGKQG